MFFGEYIIMMYYQTNEKRRREKTYQYVLVLWLSRGEGLSYASNKILRVEFIIVDVDSDIELEM